MFMMALYALAFVLATATRVHCAASLSIMSGTKPELLPCNQPFFRAVL
jgi:hypothetical protein